MGCPRFGIRADFWRISKPAGAWHAVWIETRNRGLVFDLRFSPSEPEIGRGSRDSEGCTD
jgi:hypothetical protein